MKKRGWRQYLIAVSVLAGFLALASLALSGFIYHQNTSNSPGWSAKEVEIKPIIFNLPKKDFKLTATGDLLIHRAVYRQAKRGSTYDFNPMFFEIKSYISRADLSLCHLEVPLTSDYDNLRGYPSFAAPDDLAKDIAATGWDSCSLASNHSLDDGTRGVKRTIEALRQAGLQTSGTNLTESDKEINLLTIGKIWRLAHLSYTYGTNQGPSADDWQVDLIESQKIKSEAALAKKLGADLTIVSLHWGNEYQQAPSGYQKRIARELLADGAIDLIVGHHAHVVQGIEKINDKYVAYGLGNFLSSQTPKGCNCPLGVGDGIILEIKLEVVAGRLVVAGLGYIPTRVSWGDFVIKPTAFSKDLKDKNSAARTKKAINSSKTVVGLVESEKLE